MNAAHENKKGVGKNQIYLENLRYILNFNIQL